MTILTLTVQFHLGFSSGVPTLLDSSHIWSSQGSGRFSGIQMSSTTFSLSYMYLLCILKIGFNNFGHIMYFYLDSRLY